MAKGIVAGAGAALLHAGPALDSPDVSGDYATGVAIMRQVLTAPAFLIAANAGYDGNEVVARLAGLGTDDGFDALEGQYGNMIEMAIVDPLRVARSALQNAGEPADHHVCRGRHGRPNQIWSFCEFGCPAAAVWCGDHAPSGSNRLWR